MSSIGEIITEIKELIAYVGVMRLVTYFDAAAASMFVYDYFLTIGMEVDLVWSSKWGFMEVVYVLQRYLPFVDAVFLCLLHQFSTTMDRSSCNVVEKLRGYLIITGIILSELILTIRAWAIWGRNERLGIAVSIFSVASIVASYVTLALFLRGEKFSDRPYPELQGCFVTGLSRTVYINWVILMIFEAVLLLLMLIPGVRAYRPGGHDSFYALVYRDGVMFYIYLLVLSTINVVVLTSLSENYADILTSVERCLHSMLTSRVFLNIRDYLRNARPAFSDNVADIQVNPGVTRQQKMLNSRV